LNYEYDAVVVGAGPNGLAAAITLAQAKLSVLLIEANQDIGGACRSAELTLPGFIHDSCSAIHPLAVGSPFFRSLPLNRFGLEWIQPGLPLAHPLDDQCVNLHRALEEMELGEDGRAYERLLRPLVSSWEDLANDILRPLLHWPRKPIPLIKFGLNALRPAAQLSHSLFKGEPARALFSGMAAHSFLSLDQTASSAIGLVLAMFGHATGWPLPRGGSGMITRAMGAYFRELGGKIITNQRVKNIDELPRAQATLLDLTARQVRQAAGRRLPPRYCRALENFRYGPAVFKLDYALSAPIPWKFPDCAKAGTVHLGGTLAEIEQSERQVSEGAVPDRPFVLVTQSSLFDSTRAPEGRHTAWAYCHIPQGCDTDMTDRIEEQLERCAPGFRDCVIARCARGPALLEQGNANLVGGDINGGLADLRQLIGRPVLSLNPYRTPLKGTYICSASTPPGGGVHGMPGYNAAVLCLRNEFKIQTD
jgi:phytoene dehydrogenase-like protein